MNCIIRVTKNLTREIIILNETIVLDSDHQFKIRITRHHVPLDGNSALPMKYTCQK